MTILEEKTKPVKKETKSFLPELRQLSSHLMEVESELAAFWQLNPAMLMLVRNNKIQKVNPAWETLLGYSQEDLENKSLFDLTHPEDREKLYNCVSKLKDSQESQNIIVRCINNKNQEWNFIKCIVSYDSVSDTIFCTAWPLMAKCADCPFLK